MILSILTPCNDNSNDTNKEGKEYNSDNDMVEIIQPTIKEKGKKTKMVNELIWKQETRLIAQSQQIGVSKQCKENNDLNIECKEWCTSKEQCTNKRIQNKNWKSVEKRQTENGKRYGLFVEENCKEGDLIIEYVAKVVTNKTRTIVMYTT